MTTSRTIAAALTLAGALVAPMAGAQHQHGAEPKTPAADASGAAPRRMTMHEMHRLGGVPRGWTFTVPPGDALRGRQAFADFECYKCHTVKDGGFPAVARTAADTGPELTGVGAHHPAEYFAESILDPNAIVIEGPGHIGPDGRSIMPSYADSMTLAQWTDLVAYLRSLTSGGDMVAAHHGQDGGGRAQVAGAYRVRLAYAGAAGHAHDGHAHGGTPAGGHLMAFVTDARGGEAVPYVSVTAVIDAGGTPRRVALKPTLGEDGFHYGAEIALPSGTRRISVAIGAPTVPVMPSARGRFAPATAVFDWPAAAK